MTDLSDLCLVCIAAVKLVPDICSNATFLKDIITSLSSVAASDLDQSLISL